MKEQNQNKIKESTGGMIFDCTNVLFMIFMMVIMLYPLWHVFCASLSDPRLFAAHSGALLKPVGFSLNAYRLVARNPNVLNGYINTLVILVVGVSVNMVMTILASYVLSRKKLMLKRPITLMIIFTMYFGGGLVPAYLNVKELGLYDSMWALIIPGAISTYNMIVLRTAFASIPDSLEEAARIDGASHMRVLLQIVLPLSKPTLAVVTLYYAVSHWNSWFSALIYLRDRTKYPLQLILREILLTNDTQSMLSGTGIGLGEASFVGDTVQYALIIIAVVPILMIYPFVQKYFTKGVMIGAVKG